MNPVTQRPAETAGAALAIAALIAHLLGVTDATTITTIAVVIGFVPAAVTWIVTLIKGKPGPTD